MPLNRLTAGPALVPSKQPQAARQPGEATARFRAAVRHQGTGNSSSRHRYACASAWRIHKTVNLPCVRACGVGTFTDIVRYLDVDGWRDRLPPGPYWECGKTGDADTADRQAARFGNCRRRTSPSHAGRWMEGALVSTSSRTRLAKCGRTRSHHSVRFAGLGAGSRRSNDRYAIHDRDVLRSRSGSTVTTCARFCSAIRLSHVLTSKPIASAGC